MLVLHTERLTIRPFTEDDAAFILELVNDADWLRFIGERQVHSLDDARRYLREGPLAMQDRLGHSLHCVVRASDAAALGMCGLLKRDTLEDVDLGFAFLPAARGQGFAREAAAAVLAHGFDALGLKRIVAFTDIDNTAAARVLEEVGLRFERLLPAVAGEKASRLFGRPAARLILDHVYDHEAAQPQRVFLTQPVGGGQVVDYTWARTLDEARRMAAHLQSLGLAPGARIALLTKNCAHFFIAELAIWLAGGTTVAIFPTETADTLRYVLEHSEARLLFVGKLDDWAAQASAVPAGLPCIALPLALPTAPPTAQWPNMPRWDDILARTAPLPGRPQRHADDLAMLCYTSGSTGEPKGVMHSFGRITHAVQCAIDDPHRRLPDGVPNRTLSYLPLAHIYERAVVECRNLMAGDGHVYFSESLATFLDDVKRARPTVFVSVPRLWLKFQQGVLLTLPADTLDALLADPATAAVAGRKVLASLGLDEVRQAACGAAPIPPSLLAWYRRLGLNLMEGYGMTEDFAYSHRSTREFNAAGHVGVACPGVQVRITGDGEVLIKSPGQMVGYYKRPDLNAECFTADGFFRTGDSGALAPDGQLKLTGRVKELFKTSKGKYVAPAPIETRLNAHPMVEQAIVSGVGQPQPYALVVLAESLRPRPDDAAARTRVEAELTQLLHAVNQGLAAHEQLDRLVVVHERWSVENGCLTPTMKVRRGRIEASVAPQVDGWYSRPGPVLWA